MNCETVADNMSAIISGDLSPATLDNCRRHIANCPECSEALRGGEALGLLKNRETGEVPAELFGKISSGLEKRPREARPGQRFWLGTGFGGAIAASLFALALTFGWIGPGPSESPATPEFMLALSEPRMMDVAIETDRPLKGATISILISGAVELDGYGHRRELTWTADLKAGVNRLSLPVLATEEKGGQMVVRLSHPHSEQLFVVRLRTEV